MKSEDIIKAMNNMDDKYIEEASGANLAARAEEKSIKRSKRNKFFRWAGGIAAVLVIGFGALWAGGLGRMGSAKSASAAATAVPQRLGYYYTDSMVLKEAAFEEAAVEAPMEAMASDMKMADSGLNTRSAAAGGSTGSYIDTESLKKQNLKLIYRADVSIETKEFDTTMDQVKALVEANGGYFENTQTWNGGYYNYGANRNAYLTARIPADKYSSFIDSIGSGFTVTSLNQSVEDVGQRYYEIEARLETLYTKEKRLQELLSQAAGMSDIIDLESALSDTEYQIDMYKTDLNRYDSLIGYSTVNISIQEVIVEPTETIAPKTFGETLSIKFRQGAARFVNGLKNFVYSISYNFFGILTVLVIAAVVIIIIAKIRKKKS